MKTIIEILIKKEGDLYSAYCTPPLDNITGAGDSECRALKSVCDGLSMLMKIATERGIKKINEIKHS